MCPGSSDTLDQASTWDPPAPHLEWAGSSKDRRSEITELDPPESTRKFWSPGDVPLLTRLFPARGSGATLSPWSPVVSLEPQVPEVPGRGQGFLPSNLGRQGLTCSVERLGTRGGEQWARRSRGEPRGRDAGADEAARAGAPPLRLAHTRKPREPGGAGVGSQAGPGGQVSAEGGWASRCWREQRWILAQDRGSGEVVIRGCRPAGSGGLLGCLRGRREKGYRPWPPGFPVPARGFREAAGEKAEQVLNESVSKDLLPRPNQSCVRNPSVRVG